MRTKQSLVEGILLLCFSILFSPAGFGQHEMLKIARKADVWDDAKPQTFFKIPELSSKEGVLEVHLYVSEQVYNFNGDTIKMRTYTYEHLGETYQTNIGPNGPVGPWAPTLRINKNDRLTVIIHNELPDDSTDQNYLCSLDTEFTKKFNSESFGKNFKKSIVNASRIPSNSNKPLITLGNLEGAYIETIVPDSHWIIHGRVPCPCPPGKKGTCKKVYIDYPVYLDYNFGEKTNALRIYQAMNHENDDEEHDHNTPHGFSRTNLHMHGFHVSPFQDDIFRNVDPTFSSYYTYDLADHTSGTMWYHPHIHGSTSIQVASGMSGAVIINDEFTSPEDDALKAASMPEHERLLIFNQIVYDTLIGETPDFETLERSTAPKGTTVNGIAVPKMKIRPGEVQRWRMVQSGYRSNVALQFPKKASVYQIAVDGILFDTPRKIETLHMVPGNRSDILIQFPLDSKPEEMAVESITYIPECEYFEMDDSCRWIGENSKEEDLMIIVVAGSPIDMEFPTTLPDNGHKTIDFEELVNQEKPRQTTFYVGPDPDPLGDSSTVFTINEQEYDGTKIPDTLVVGDAEQWLIGSNNASHPYHIHVNPFQVHKYGGRDVVPPMWKDVVMVDPTHSAVVYARYEKYWGDFVLHCHILAHEDEGMMQRVRIIRPKQLPQ